MIVTCYGEIYTITPKRWKQYLEAWVNGDADTDLASYAKHTGKVIDHNVTDMNPEEAAFELKGLK
jgi:hypothetical protein